MSTIETAEAQAARGNDNPVLAIHPLAIRDYNPGMQFLDIMKMARGWIGHRPGEWGGMSRQQLENGGYLDENGWPTYIPEELESIGTVWEWKSGASDRAERTGTYVLRYEGTGELQLKGVDIVSRKDGEIVFNSDGTNMFLYILSTTDGDHLRNISVVNEKYVDLYDAGATFNPEWLSLIEDSRNLRFMWWQDTVGSNMVETADRSTAASAPTKDVALEHLVQLANEVGSDPWFTMPHKASDAFIRDFAIYVRDNLDPSLKVRVEYSNENWNWSYEQTRWLHEKSVEEWGIEAHVDYHAKMAVNTALIWKEVFSETPDRLITVLGSHTENVGHSKRILEAPAWKRSEPDDYIDPKTVFDELSITTYFGSRTMRNDKLRDELLTAIRDPDVDAIAFLHQKLTDPTYPQSIQYVAEKMREHSLLAQESGLTLSLYEGGQHVHHLAGTGLRGEELDLLTAFMKEFVNSPQMSDLYQRSWDSWKEIGESPYMQFGDMQEPNKWGSFGVFEGLDDITDRGQLLLDLNATTDPWWDAQGGEHYQQGVTEFGTDAADLMIGTSQEDYLIGGKGDDSFVAGREDDGINGGEGHDRALFDGILSSYTIRKEGDGFRVEGPDGSDFLINVEELMFDNSQTALLSNMIEQADGTLVLDPALKEETLNVAPSTNKIVDGSTSKKVVVGDPDSPAGVEIESISDRSALGQALEGLKGNGKAAYRIAPDPEATPEGVLSGDVLLDALNNSTIVVSPEEIWATDRDDRFIGRHVDDHVHGRGGADRMTGAGGADRFDGGEGDDVLHGGIDDDILTGGLGNDLLIGGHDNDDLSGDAGDDWLFGGNGNDVMRGGAGQDNLRGGRDSDRLYGGDEADLLRGQGGNDMIYGEDGDDNIGGNGGDDFIHGGTGNDRIFGGAGNDTMTGGTGQDFFYHLRGSDRIVDFTTEDRLRLRETVEAGDVTATGEGLLISLDASSVLLEGLAMEDMSWVMPNIV